MLLLAILEDVLFRHRSHCRIEAPLRLMEPEARDYDDTVMALMRDVIHHVADEETIVLPAAERLLGDELGQLGIAMTKRRVQLVAPRSGEIALNMGRAASGNTAAMAIAVIAALGFLLAGRSRHTRRNPPSRARRAYS